MTYLHLLSPEGEPFEVIEHRAGKLLSEGWTFNPTPLERSINRIDEVVEHVAYADDAPSAGAIVDAQNLANDAPVEVDEEAPVEAGPQPEDQEANVVDGPATERVEDADPAPRKSRRGTRNED
jgi:hypothetical protein